MTAYARTDGACCWTRFSGNSWLFRSREHAWAPCVQRLTPAGHSPAGAGLKPEHRFNPLQHQIAVQEFEHGLLLRDRIGAAAPKTRLYLSPALFSSVLTT